MKQIRKSIFETNSSSSHVIVLDDSEISLKKEKQEELLLKLKNEICKDGKLQISLYDLNEKINSSLKDVEYKGFSFHQNPGIYGIKDKFNLVLLSLIPQHLLNMICDIRIFNSDTDLINKAVSAFLTAFFLGDKPPLGFPYYESARLNFNNFLNTFGLVCWEIEAKYEEGCEDFMDIRFNDVVDNPFFKMLKKVDLKEFVLNPKYCITEVDLGLIKTDD